MHNKRLLPFGFGRGSSGTPGYCASPSLWLESTGMPDAALALALQRLSDDERGSVRAARQAGMAGARPLVDVAWPIDYRGYAMPRARELPPIDSADPGAVPPGSLWVTARSATIGDVTYARLAPVLVAIVDAKDDGWWSAVPFGIDESDATPDEIVIDRAASSLRMPLRFAVHHRLCLRAEQLERSVGQVDVAVCDALRRALSDDPGGREDAADPHHAADPAVAGSRPDPAVLMVLQRPWWTATGRLPG